MKHLTLLVLLLTFSFFSAYSQNSDWKKELQQIQTESAKFEWLIEALRSNKQYPEKELFAEATRIANELHSDSISGKLKFAIGANSLSKGRLQEAWKSLQEAKILALRAKNYTLATRAVINQGAVLANQRLFDSLIHHLDKNNPIFLLCPDPQIKNRWNNMYAVAYMNLGKSAEALKVLHTISDISLSLHDTAMSISCYLNMGMLQESIDSTLFWYRKALPLAQKTSIEQYAEVLLKIGYRYYNEDGAKRDSALSYLLEAEKNVDQLKNPITRFQIVNTLGSYFVSYSEDVLALPRFQKAYLYIKGISSEEYIVTNNLTACFLNLRKLDSAAFYLDLTAKGALLSEDYYISMLYYQTKAKYEGVTLNDSCALNVLKSHEQALKYAANIEETRIAFTVLRELIPCILKYNAENPDIKKLAASVLEYCNVFQPSFKTSENLQQYSQFLSSYADLESAYGSHTKANILYNELADLLTNRINENYSKGMGEAAVKYKSELKDIEIATEKKVNMYLIGGLALLFIATVVVFVVLQKTYKLNKQVVAQKQELEQLNQIKNRLFSVISHDMRTPVNSLISFTQLLDNKNLSSEKLAAYSAQLRNTLGYTAGLMDNLLNWARSQMHGYKPILERFDLAELSSQTILLLEQDATHKKVKIENNIPDNTYVFADIHMTSLLLRNLLSNAIKYSYENGVIKLSASSDLDTVILNIKDVGTGMPINLVSEFNNASVVSPLESTQGTANEKGTGLGLMLCKSFAALMNGSITVESETGKGTCFIVQLKIAG